jgi:hypothetical protein
MKIKKNRGLLSNLHKFRGLSFYQFLIQRNIGFFIVKNKRQHEK